MGSWTRRRSSRPAAAKLHIGDERGAGEVAEIAQVMLAATVPVVRRLAAWYLAVHAMASGDPHQAHRWLCALGEAERRSVFPLFPMEAADDPLLVRMALAVGDREGLAKAVAELAARRYELNPGVPSIAAAAHAQGLLNGSRQDLEQAAGILVTCRAAGAGGRAGGSGVRQAGRR